LYPVNVPEVLPLEVPFIEKASERAPLELSVAVTPSVSPAEGPLQDELLDVITGETVPVYVPAGTESVVLVVAAVLVSWGAMVWLEGISEARVFNVVVLQEESLLERVEITFVVAEIDDPSRVDRLPADRLVDPKLHPLSV
jgi:hypothetical protein